MQGYEDVHDPVMRDRIVELLRPALQHPGAVYVDGTLGLADMNVSAVTITELEEFARRHRPGASALVSGSGRPL